MSLLTGEQEGIIESACIGNDLWIEAYAGTGKTFTMRQIAAQLHERNKDCLYLAFNRDIAHYARKTFTSNTFCATAHSLAFGRIPHLADPGRLSGKLTPRLVADVLKLEKFENVSATTCARLILQAIHRFCFDDHSEITREHFGCINSIGIELSNFLTEKLFQKAEELWHRLVVQGSSLPITHDVYLKAWTLTNPKLAFDCIFFDESQDANRAMARLVLDQAGSQQIFVGDRFQQIYGWRGSCDASTMLGKHFLRKSLTQSFRFGETIASVANQIITVLGATKPLLGLSNAPVLGAEHKSQPAAVIARTNLVAIEEAFKLVDRYKVALLVDEDFQQFVVEATRFANNEAVEHPAFIGYNEWADFKIAANNGDCQEYAPWIRCIEEFGGETLIRLFGKLSREEGAEHVVTTAHRAKGREWPCVRLTNDFRSPELSDDREEGRLLYVAATRAMLRLDCQHNSAIRHYAAISPYTTYVERDEFGFGKISYQTDDKPDDLRDIGKALCRIGELLQGHSKDLGGLSKQVPLDTLLLLDAVREFDNRVINKYVGSSASNLGPNTDINTALTDCNERLTPILKRLDHLPLLTQTFCKNDHFGRIKLAYEAGSINMNGWISIPSNCQGSRITYQFSIPSFLAPNQAARNTVIELRDQTTDRPAGIFVIWLPNAYSVVSSHSGFGILIKECLSDEATAHYRQENLFEKIMSLFAPNENQGQSQLGNTIPLVLNGVVENNKAEDDRDSASQTFSIGISQMLSYKELLSGVATSVGMASGLF